MGTRAVMGPPMFDARAGGFDIGGSKMLPVGGARADDLLDVGLYREFKDEEEFQAYRVHPTHMA